MARYNANPGVQIAPATVQYTRAGEGITLDRIAKLTPKPKGHSRFSSIEVVHAGGPVAERLVKAPRIDVVPVRFYQLPDTAGDPTAEFRAIFELEEQMMLQRANRQSLIVWIGRPDRPELDGFAGLLGMLPFRGVSVALLSADADKYPDPFSYCTPSGVLAHDANDPVRMGKCCIMSMFGPLKSRTFTSTIGEWSPIDVQPTSAEPMKRLPFKIAGLSLPMITYTGEYDGGVAELAARLAGAYAAGSMFPIISCGAVVDLLGYGLDILSALEAKGFPGFYFTHRSGETNKKWAEYGKPELMRKVAAAKAAGQRVLFIAVGGGCNGNATGVVAAMTNSDFVEVPTTPLHYNDATTSAKKAFSLVIDGKIRSKNLLGTFYLPRLVFCINETLLTSNSASIHSTVGECTKTMNMIAMASSEAGRADYENILGAHEFASDTTKILSCVDGFEHLISFIHHPAAREAKAAVMRVGGEIARARAAALAAPDAAAAARAQAELAALVAERRALLRAFRGHFYSLPEATRSSVDEFLTVSNLEIVGAKAMFLAYEDPFEKYRALLFEYAHTLGHAVEAWLAGVHETARAAGIPEAELEAAVRNHGQCVGMAVVWAGHISHELGVLTGDGYICHQSMVALFNGFGGFSFAPVRKLCDRLGITKDDFLREAIAGVRLDNKRGYCECGENVSVDQLVTNRPGQMLRSDDHNAEVRYMVTIDEDRQKEALERAFDLEFDTVAHLEGGEIAFKPLASAPRPVGVGAPIAAEIRHRIRRAYEADAATAARQQAALSDALSSRASSEGEQSPTATGGAFASPSDSPKSSSPPPSTIGDASPGSTSPGSTSPKASARRWPMPSTKTDDDLSRSGTVPGELCELCEEEPKDAIKSWLEKVPDFSPYMPTDYRAGYGKWRAGNAHGAKGELLDEFPV